MEEAGLFKGSNSGLPELGTLAYANQEITFDVLKSTAMRTCMECHTTGRNAMGTPAEALALSGKILSEISSNAMPPKSSGYKTLTDCEKQIVETWLEDQAKSRKSVKIKDLPKCQGAVAPPKEEKPDISKLEVTFANLQKYIIAPKCLSCHAHDVEDVETVLDSVQGMHDAGVLAETAEESKIYQIVLPTAKRQMPPLKSGLPRLTVDEQVFLKTWIDKGAKEDTL
ncbi:hypothetical protein [Bdellovibrio svalbardensis]|uniref:Cytochrome c domain-containing protein n=1 Tax=Bdellovibrio svalbardensis TaxID=2972972 RepID=A0ABT6DM50_9BACT|nr:hypothetical protein [Bdellovibrio svalbardensis]MDG0816213.1 hypothetical protein [Bdellovibrio svalbardensis]